MFHYLTNKERTINAALLIIEQLGGSCDFHRLFKLLYFADQKHLVQYGTPISQDKYIGMAHGPVPSELYDILKFVRSGGDNPIFSVTQSGIPTVTANQKSNPDELSETAIECLLESIQENKDLSFKQLTEKSHKQAWAKAHAQTEEIDFIDIAAEGGADEGMLKYIKLTFENHNVVKYYATAR